MNIYDSNNYLQPLPALRRSFPPSPPFFFKAGPAGCPLSPLFG